MVNCGFERKSSNKNQFNRVNEVSEVNTELESFHFDE